MKCSRRYCQQEPVDGYKMCADCRQYYRVFTRNRKRKQEAAGLCNYSTCKNRPVDGRAMCRKHLDRQAAHQLIRTQLLRPAAAIK